MLKEFTKGIRFGCRKKNYRRCVELEKETNFITAKRQRRSELKMTLENLKLNKK